MGSKEGQSHFARELDEALLTDSSKMASSSVSMSLEPAASGAESLSQSSGEKSSTERGRKRRREIESMDHSGGRSITDIKFAVVGLNLHKLPV